jgi:endoglucanase
MLYPYNVFWDENFRAVKDYPVNLPRDKLVYGVNTYEPDIYVQLYIDNSKLWFSIRDQNWGYLTSSLL